MKALLKLLTISGLIFTLSACVFMPDETADIPVEWEMHSQLLSQIGAFQASGKIAYLGPDEKVSLNFYWKHSANISELRFLNLFGSTVMTLTMTPNGAEMLTEDGDIYRDLDANRLFARLTKMNFPVTQMQDWIIGLPTDVDSYQFNDINTIDSLSKLSGKQSWTLNYNRYVDFHDFPMPSLMTLNNEDTRVKISVSKWVLN